MNKTYHLEKVEPPAEHIRVSAAMSQVEEEAIPVVKATASVSSYISEHPADDGGQIFNNVVTSRQRALTTLANSNFWSKTESDF